MSLVYIMRALWSGCSIMNFTGKNGKTRKSKPEYFAKLEAKFSNQFYKKKVFKAHMKN
jgi:hypothetical protein